jgi:potassium/hydrogen antiporter
VEPSATAGVLALTGGILLVSALVSSFSNRVGVPMLLLFLGVGIVAGSEGLGGVAFEDYGLAFRLGTLALVVILFDGGLSTPIPVVRRALWPAASLATLGVVLTAALLAGVGLLLGLPLPLAVLIGAIVSSTDAAAVFAVLRSSGIRLRARVGAILEVESGLNDPMAVALTIMATELILAGEPPGLATLGSVAAQLGLGLVGGIGCGLGGRKLLQRVPLPASGLYPVVAFALALAAFGLTTLVGGSGFLAVYLCGVVLGGTQLPYEAGIRRVHDALAWLAQMLMFGLLGLLVFPSRLWPEALLGVTLALALAVLARPLAVLVSLLPFRLPWRERAFLSWVGLRGAVPIVLAAYPVLRGAPESERVFHLVFFIVLVNALVPGATVSWLARRFRLSRTGQPAPPVGIDLVTARPRDGSFVWYQILAPSAVAGSTVSQLPLPERCVMVFLMRKDEVVPVRGPTELQIGDHVCLFVHPDDRPLLDLLFGFDEGDAA